MFSIEHVSKIARIKLTEKEKKIFKKDLEDMLSAFGIIDEICVADVDPSFSPLRIKNRMRKDEVKQPKNRDEILSNTKNKENNYFKAPRAV